MNSGLMITIAVFVLVLLFGLIVLLDRRKTEKEESSDEVPSEARMSPQEIWDKHVEKLRELEKSE